MECFKMTITAKNISKIQSVLNQVQKRCTQRLLTKNDITEMIENAKQERENTLTDILGRKYLKSINIHKSFNVPNCYNYKAYTTIANVNITKYGKITVNIFRGSASKIPYGLDSYKITKCFE